MYADWSSLTHQLQVYRQLVGNKHVFRSLTWISRDSGWPHSLSLPNFLQKMGNRWCAELVASAFQTLPKTGCGKRGGQRGRQLGNAQPRRGQTVPSSNWAGLEIGKLESFGTFASQEVNWCMEVICHGLCLPLEDHMIIRWISVDGKIHGTS